MMERMKGGLQPCPDRPRAAGGQLLRHHDGAEPGKARRPPPQIRPACLLQYRRQARVGLDEPLQRLVQIGVGVEEMSHWFLSSSAKADDPVPSAGCYLGTSAFTGCPACAGH